MDEKYSIYFTKRAEDTLNKMDKYQANIILSWIKKNLVNCHDLREHGKILTGKYKNS